MGSETHMSQLLSGLGTGQAQCGGTAPTGAGVVTTEGMAELAGAWPSGGNGGRQRRVSSPAARLLPSEHWDFFPSGIYFRI